MTSPRAPPYRSTKVLIGPIAPRFARAGPLQPPAVAAFVDSAPAGVAVVSFGSAPIFGAFLTPEDFRGLARAFADMAPMRVLWLLKAGGRGGRSGMRAACRRSRKRRPSCAPRGSILFVHAPPPSCIWQRRPLLTQCVERLLPVLAPPLTLGPSTLRGARIRPLPPTAAHRTATCPTA
jgi:hypothetical protein